MATTLTVAQIDARLEKINAAIDARLDANLLLEEGAESRNARVESIMRLEEMRDKLERQRLEVSLGSIAGIRKAVVRHRRAGR